MPPDVMGDGTLDEGLPLRTPQLGIGMITPFDFALDRELWRWLPDDISVLLTRTPHVPHPVGLELAMEVSVDDHVRVATQSVLTVEPDVVAYACTSGSFVGGAAGERRLRTVIHEAGAAAAVTTSGALVDAFRVLGVGRVALATPYVAEVNTSLQLFLAEAGISSVSSHHLDLDSRIWTVDYATTWALALAADRPEAEAVFVSCTNVATYDLIGPLEERLGKPVISANQVTLWAALGVVGRALAAPRQRLAATPFVPGADVHGVRSNP